ncbi:MAG: hypothetical protein WCI87_04110 [Euryarchaeota archaeon]
MDMKVTVIAVGLLLISTIATAGCISTSQSSPTPTSRLFAEVSASPSIQATPTPSAGPQDVIAYFEGILTGMKFAIKQPLSHSINTIGNDVYRGTVASGTTTASVEIQTFDNIQDTQQGAQAYRDAFVGQGYVTRDDQSTYWSGTTNTGEAWIIVDTTDLYVMAFWY